jgi:hypothetical protein
MFKREAIFWSLVLVVLLAFTKLALLTVATLAAVIWLAVLLCY